MIAVVTDEPGSRLRVARLTVLERLVVALHRAGLEAITVVGRDPLPEWERLSDLGVHVDRSPSRPAVDRAVTASGALFARPEDVRRTVIARGRLVDRAGSPLPLACEGSDPPIAVTAGGPAFVVNGEAARRRAERILWASLATSSDGLVDRWLNRPLARPLTKLLVHTRVSPNQVTLAGILVGLAGAACVASADSTVALVGAIVFQLSTVVDCVDGDLARVLFKESRFGHWLDLGLDQVGHSALFAAIAIHCFRASPDTPALALGASSIVGAILAFAVVVRGMRLPPERRDPRLARLLDRMTNRDFTLAVVFLAALEMLDVFLWLAGTFTHLFWALALAAQLRKPSSVA